MLQKNAMQILIGYQNYRGNKVIYTSLFALTPAKNAIYSQNCSKGRT